MKIAWVVWVSLLAGCGTGGPPAPDWKADSADLIERYKSAALEGENALAERYFQQALMATGRSGRIADTARLWLVHCATRRASLIDDDCHDYAELARYESDARDRAYYRLVTLDWKGLDTAALPRAYAALVKAEPGAVVRSVAAIADPLSRLLAASLVVMRGDADDALLGLAAETASAQGWRQPLLVYLKLLQQHAAAAGDATAEQRYALRIRLVDDSLTPAAPK